MYRIGQVAARLDVSPASLRHWSERFAEWLSDPAENPDMSENGQRATRTYTEEDLLVLEKIVHLQAAGLDEEAIEAQLKGGEQEGRSGALTIVEQEQGEMVLNNQEAAALALRQLAESQQAQRELLNLVVNNAVALKDENDRLRRRLRVLEEDIARLKESDWNHRLSLEERLGQLEREQEKRRPWWERFFNR